MEARERCMRRVEALDQELLLGNSVQGLDGSAFCALEQVGHHLISFLFTTGVSCVPLSVLAVILRKGSEGGNDENYGA